MKALVHYATKKTKNDLLKLRNLRLFRRVILFLLGGVFAVSSLGASTAVFAGGFVEAFLNIHADAEQLPDSSFAKTVRIYFRVNRATIERDYMDNDNALTTIDQVFINNLLDDEDFIVITGKASPEGDFKNNLRLSEERARALKNYIKQKYSPIKDNQIVILPGGEDWDGLLEMVEKDKNIPGRDQLLQLLNSNLSRESQKVKMHTIDNGETYSYLLTHILPYLRGNVSGTIYSKKEIIETVRTDIVELLRVDTVFVEKEIVRIDTIYPEVILQKQKSTFVMAVKNNLLYDIGLLPNLAVEIPFGHNYNWSVAIEGNWSWWNTQADNYYYHRIQMGGIELRRWFGNKTHKPLNGWYVGAYGYGGTYDLRLFTDKNSDRGQLSNWSYSGGITLGYALPIAKRFNLEFGLGLGYLGGTYYKYNVGECAECAFPKLSTHNRNYWGPTKAGISLVWLIGNINRNKRKEEQP